jgi:hypothetical protein
MLKLLEECPPVAACIIRTQNFKGAYEVSSGPVEETVAEVQNTVEAAVPKLELSTSETGLAAPALDGALDTANAAAP